MEQFLLIIIMVLFLVIIIITYLFRLIFRFSFPYSSAVVHHPRTIAPVEESKSKGSPTTILLIVSIAIVLAYLTMSNSKSFHQVVNLDEPHLVEPKSGETIPKAPLPDQVIISNQIDSMGTLTTDQPEEIEDQWPIDRYNQGPYAALPAVFFTIQLRAFNSEDNAVLEAERLELTLDDLHILYMDEEIPFKIVVGVFDNREEALDYKNQNSLDGFIKEVKRV